MARGETGLGTNGVRNKSPEAPAVLRLDRMQGWQSLRSVSGENDDALTDLTAPPADAVELPDDGDLIQFRALSQAAGAVVVEVYFFPFAASDAEAGVGAGWKETLTLTTAAGETAKGLSNATLAATASPASPAGPTTGAAAYVSRVGAYKMAARIITRQGTDSELLYRVI
jgi:hypothetical protein